MSDVTDPTLHAALLDAQLNHARAIHRMARIITREGDPSKMREAMVAIIGEHLDVDRVLIYDIRFPTDEAEALCEWLNPNGHAEPTKGSYPLSMFRGTAEYVHRERCAIESHIDDVHPKLLADGADQVLHNLMNIKSLLWFPFDMEPTRASLLVFNQVERMRRWSEADLAFVDAIAELVSMAHLRVRLELKERERLVDEDRRRHLESLGLLAGGVAHDFNNLLAVMFGHTDLVSRGLPENSELRIPLATLREALEAASQMCRQLLDFRSPSHVERSRFDINVLARQTLSVLEASVTERIRLHVGSEPVWLFANRIQVQQVLLNLLLNAAQALPEEGGEVAIRTGHLTEEQAIERGVTLWDRRSVGPLPFVEVRDSGVGMDEATMATMFAPFESHKSTGSGLGLATVRNVIERHDARVAVQSTVSEGTAILVVFPCPESPVCVAQLSSGAGCDPLSK